MDAAELASAVVPYVSAVAGAYGGAVLERVRDRAADAGADATVGLGRRVLRRLLGREGSSAVIEGAVVDLAGDPGDTDLQAAVRVQVRKALREDDQLRVDLAALLAEAGVAAGSSVTVIGSQGVQVGDHNRQTNTFGAGSS